MAGNFAYMKKKGGKVVRVPLNKWANYRRSGYAFSTEEDYARQQAGNRPADPAPTQKKVSKKKKS